MKTSRKVSPPPLSRKKLFSFGNIVPTLLGSCSTKNFFVLSISSSINTLTINKGEVFKIFRIVIYFKLFKLVESINDNFFSTSSFQGKRSCTPFPSLSLDRVTRFLISGFMLFLYAQRPWFLGWFFLVILDNSDKIFGVIQYHSENFSELSNTTPKNV